MIKAIIKKEWLKLRLYIFTLFFMACISFLYFWYNISYSFATIEPESMMWFRFSNLGFKPYFSLIYIFLFFGGVIALATFLPERIGNRIKIMAHLPLSMSKALFLHLFIGGLVVFLLGFVFSFLIFLVMQSYYPSEIVVVSIKDLSIYTLLSIGFYFGISSVVLEKSPLVGALKLVIVVLIIFAFLKERYFLIDAFGLFLLVFIPFMVLDSFYTTKEQRLDNVMYKISFVIVEIAVLFFAYNKYSESYPKNFTHYYIFYSNIVGDFIYQKNYEGHRFTYGIKDKEEFDKDRYESLLPFVYYKDLDIQNKLPVTIKNNVFNKKDIQNSRLSFSYNHTSLKNQEVNLYPLLNPQTKEGVIKFPEEAFSIFDKKAVVYTEHNNIDKTLSVKLTQELRKHNFDFDIKHIWGKSTNMKPYDKGYLILDGKNKLFNIKREDGMLNIKEINYPKDIKLAYINISENKQKILSGYAIDTNSNFYLLNWDFTFIALELKHFDYKKMKLQIITNPLNYLVRYNDNNTYRAVVFDKELKVIKSIKMDK